MRNALNEYQTIALIGGTSDIGGAIVDELCSRATRRVVLACRDTVAGARTAAAIEHRHRGLVVDVVAYDAERPETHPRVIHDIASLVGDIDVAIFAVGVLGDQSDFDDDPVAAARATSTNTVAGVSTCLALTSQMRQQGHGSLVVLSSVAGERVRRANFVYGASKAGLDAFAQGLGDALVGSGVSVLIVRPGFVRSSMTEGMAAAPFATTPAAVAEATASGLASRRRIVWVPGILRLVFWVFRHLPTFVWRRLPI